MHNRPDPKNAGQNQTGGLPQSGCPVARGRQSHWRDQAAPLPGSGRVIVGLRLRRCRDQAAPLPESGIPGPESDTPGKGRIRNTLQVKN